MPEDVQASAGCEIGRDYPAPIVDHKTAYAEARSRMASIRRRDAAREEAQKVYERHGSRRRPRPRQRATRKDRPDGDR